MWKGAAGSLGSHGAHRIHQPSDDGNNHGRPRSLRILQEALAMSKFHLKKFRAPDGSFIASPHGKARGISNGRRRAKELFKKQNGRCWLCGKQMTMTRGLDNSCTVDHFIPQSRGGTHSKKNLRGACRWCNKWRGNRLFSELATLEVLRERPSTV